MNSENILKELAALASLRTENSKKIISPDEMKSMAGKKKEKHSHEFLNALNGEKMSFICEVKKASPSKGIITQSFDHLKIAAEYEAAGADALSVLTEPQYFKGSINYLRTISEKAGIPALRKDFTVDPYMIYEACANGASAVLLICSILDDRQLVSFSEICNDLNIDALFEAHDEEEIKRALAAGARIIGVNNRDLKDFSVDNSKALKLRKYVPDDIVFVSESGIKTGQDVILANDAGADAVLVGEALMRASDKRKKLAELKNYDKAEDMRS